MTTTLAALISPALIIAGLGLLFNPSWYMELYTTVKEERFALFLFSLIGCIIGSWMVINHWVWGSVSAGIVSLVGLGLLVKSVLFLLLPRQMYVLIERVSSPVLLRIGAILWICAGLYLLLLFI